MRTVNESFCWVLFFSLKIERKSKRSRGSPEQLETTGKGTLDHNEPKHA